MKEFKHYKLLSEQPVPEYRSHGYHLRHEESGAEIFILQNQDEENFFSFGFRTPSENDCGLAHILEHSVLAGSKNYPIKDPFLTLLRSSMQTFLNAMTYPDKTLYPAASPVKQDFFNLFDVYGDAVFFPLISKETFWQEGYRLIYKPDSQNLEHAGVVYNEMKGAYSSIEGYAFDAVIQSLHPTNSYQYDSGGNPDHIPNITYEMLVNFHKKYYHPNNSKIFLYGNVPIEEKLERLHDKFLQHFKNQEATNSQVIAEPAFTERHYEVREFPSRGDDDTCYISLNWLTAPLTETKTTLALEVLNHILLGSSGAPLYVALQRSGLGQDLSPVCGFSFDFNRAIFSAGLRGIKPEDQTKFEKLVDQSLLDIINNGIDQESIESALRAVEMQRRELRSGSFGLRLMGRLYKGWNYDLNPFSAILFEEPMAELRKEAFNKGYFEAIIRHYLVDNPHSSLTLITPNAELAITKDLAIEKALQEQLASMNESQKEQLLLQDKNLDLHQSKEDDPTVMPRLQRSDIPQKVKEIESKTEKILGDRPLHIVDEFSNGLYYWNIIFNLNDFTQEDLLWLPFLCRAMSGLGSDKRDYITISQAIARDSGGFNLILDTGSYLDENGNAQERSAILHINFKALESQLNELPKTLQEALFSINFQDPERLQALYWELYNEMAAAVVPSGSGVAGLRLSRLFSQSAYTEELWHGVEQLLFLEQLANKWQDPLFTADLITRFESLSKRILIKERASFGIVAPDPIRAKSTLEELFTPLATLPSLSMIPTTSLSLPHAQREFVTTNSEVNFVGLAIPAHAFNQPQRASEILLGQYLTVGTLWHAIRMQGGAYGVSASVSGNAEGIFTMTSYRDPQMERTLDVFKEALTHFTPLSQEELDDTLIARIGKENRPQGPNEALTLAMKRKLYNITTSLRQELRDHLLQTTPQSLREVASILAKKVENAKVVIITNTQEAEKHSTKLGIQQTTALAK